MNYYKDHYYGGFGHDEYELYRDTDEFRSWTCGDMDIPDVVMFRTAFSEVSEASQLLRDILEEAGIDWHRRDEFVGIGGCSVDQLLSILRLNVELARKLNTAVSALDTVNDQVVTAQEQAYKVERTISELEK